MARHPDASEWYHQWVYFRPRAYWHEWLNWPTIFAQTGFFRPDEQWQARFGELFGQIVDAGQGAGALFRTVGDKPAGTAAAAADGGDQRIAASAAGLTRCATPASTSATIWRTAILISPASPSASACRPRVCRTCSASGWGSSVLGWREDQRISQAKLLLQHHADADRHRWAQRRLRRSALFFPRV